MFEFHIIHDAPSLFPVGIIFVALVPYFTLPYSSTSWAETLQTCYKCLAPGWFRARSHRVGEFYVYV